jgi:hypothetical protein
VTGEHAGSEKSQVRGDEELKVENCCTYEGIPSMEDEHSSEGSRVAFSVLQWLGRGYAVPDQPDNFSDHHAGNQAPTDIEATRHPISEVQLRTSSCYTHQLSLVITLRYMRLLYGRP